MSDKLTGYDLSRQWFDWCFENPELINANHAAIYFFAIEHCNRMGWKEKFGFPTQMTMDALGIKKHGTFIKYFNELVLWGFIKLIQKSKNQYSANIISLVNAIPKSGKALDKAFIKHAAKQRSGTGQSTGQSNSTIIKQRTKNNKQETNKQDIPSFFDFESYVISKVSNEDFNYIKQSLKFKYDAWFENGWRDGYNVPIKKWKSKILHTIPHLLKNNNGKQNPGDERLVGRITKSEKEKFDKNVAIAEELRNRLQDS